jgi:hypothetical protein
MAIFVDWTVVKFTIRSSFSIQRPKRFEKKNEFLTQTNSEDCTDPVKLLTTAYSIQDTGQWRADEANQESRKPHFRSSDATVPQRQLIGDEISEMASHKYGNQGANDGSNERQTRLPGLKSIYCGERRREIGRDDNNHANGYGTDQCGPEHRWKSKREDWSHSKLK